jgi:hypothetical protein
MGCSDPLEPAGSGGQLLEGLAFTGGRAARLEEAVPGRSW